MNIRSNIRAFQIDLASAILSYLSVYKESLVYIEIFNLSPKSNIRRSFMHAKLKTECENEKGSQV
jgi:hypothetical protein